MSYGRAWRATNAKRRVRFDSTRLAGVEWEYNRVDGGSTSDILEECLKKWRGTIHDDRSCGYEVVTAPLAGDYIAQCLGDLGYVLNKSQARINRNCSIHVHVDAHDLSWNAMYRLLWVYSRVEEVLFLLGGKHRSRNRYCRPCGKEYRKALEGRFAGRNPKLNWNIKHRVLKVAYWGQVGAYDDPEGIQQEYEAGDSHHNNRYVALNIHPWLAGKRNGQKQHQTVEFRLHERTLDKERVIRWTQLLVQLVDWAHKSSDQRARQLSENGLLALIAMCPKSRRWILTRADKWKEVFKL